jgi:iron complex outermembrane receptor protein
MRSGYFSNSPEALASALAIAAGVALSTGTAEAQTATGPAANQVETVVVTAERRATNVQTTPISVSVLSADDLVKKGVTSLDGLMFATPALTVNNFGQGNMFNIRGLGKGENNIQTPSGVTTYIDGAAIPGTFFQDFPFYDLSSVEILRGPQGTFAGENATAGAVFITTEKPNFDGYNGYAQAQFGNYTDVGLQGAVNMPITDELAMRISVYGERRDSFYSVTGPYTGNPGSLLEGAGRIELLWRPTAAFEAYLYSEYSNVNRGGYPDDPATLSCTKLPTPSCVPNTSDPFKVTNDTNNEALEYGQRTVLDLKYTFPSGIMLRSISSDQYSSAVEQTDLSGTDIPAYNGYLFHDHGEEKIISEEVNLLSPSGGQFSWLLGAFFQHDHVDLPYNNGTGFVIGAPAPTAYIILQYHTPKQHEAVFGQATYDITPALQLQAGLRYNYSYFDLRDEQQTVVTGVGPVATFLAPCPSPIPAGVVCTNQTHQSDSALTGKIDLNYKLDEANFLYAFVATGHKDGGLNTRPSSYGPGNPPAVIAPEKLVDYEAGWKSGLFGGHLLTTLDGFYNDYKDFQVTLATGPGQTGILNAPTATVYGIEAQGQAVFGDLSFDFSGAYIHGTFGTDFAADPRFDDVENIAGHQMVFSPHWTFNAGVQYAFQMGSGDTLTPRVDYAFVDTQTTSVFDVPGLDQLGARNIVNAQLTYAMQNNWSIAAYATNLTNDHYIASFYTGLGILPGTSSNLRAAGPPQQFGLRVTKDF